MFGFFALPNINLFVTRKYSKMLFSVSCCSPGSHRSRRAAEADSTACTARGTGQKCMVYIGAIESVRNFFLVETQR